MCDAVNKKITFNSPSNLASASEKKLVLDDVQCEIGKVQNVRETFRFYFLNFLFFKNVN